MSVPIAMNVPGGRPLVGWWRDLSTYAPLRLWFAHLLLHRLEVLIEGDGISPFDALANALLTNVRARFPSTDLRSLQVESRLESSLFQRLVDHLVRTGMMTLDTEGHITEIQATPPCPPRLRQRRILHFTEGTPTYFLPLPDTICSALMPSAGWTFDLSQLDRFAAQPFAWRQDNLFPTDIHRFLRPADLPEPVQAEAVIVCRAEQVLLALIQTGEQILGFPVTTENWTLQKIPCLALPLASDFAEALLAPLSIDAWRQGWQGWCQQRSLPGVDVEACKLESVDHRLVVRAPARLVDRLRQGRNEAMRGEGWLLAGTGRIRHAALLEVT